MAALLFVTAVCCYYGFWLMCLWVLVAGILALWNTLVPLLKKRRG